MIRNTIIQDETSSLPEYQVLVHRPSHFVHFRETDGTAIPKPNIKGHPISKQTILHDCKNCNDDGSKQEPDVSNASEGVP